MNFCKLKVELLEYDSATVIFMHFSFAFLHVYAGWWERVEIVVCRHCFPFNQKIFNVRARFMRKNRIFANILQRKGAEGWRTSLPQGSVTASGRAGW